MVIFSDQPGSIARATTNIEHGQSYVYVPASRVFNFAEVTVRRPVRVSDWTCQGQARVRQRQLLDHRRGVLSQQSGVVPVQLRVHRVRALSPKTLTVSYGLDSADRQGATATVYWAVDAGPNDRGPVLAGDVLRKQIVVDDGDGPVLLTYDDSDRFNVAGRPATLAVFEAQLADVLNNPGRQLAWSNYEAGRAHRVAEFSLI